MLYNKFLKKKILKKFWIFFCVDIKYTFKINYLFLNSLYSKNCFTDIFIFISSVKRLFPFLNNGIKKNHLLFVGAKFLYSKTLCKVDIIAHHLIYRNPGIFSNFSITSFYTMDNLSLKVLPKIILFINLGINNLLLKEAKSKNIPIVALLDTKDDSGLIDYPIVVDSAYFYTTFFFSSFFFRFFSLR